MDRNKWFDYYNSGNNLIDDRGSAGAYSFDVESDFYKNYICAIHNIKVFTKDEEISYFKKYKDTLDLDIKKEIICRNLPLVSYVAKNFLNKGLEFEELVQEGNIGLMRAVDNFDIDKGFKFSTFAYYYIRASVAASICNKSRTIRIPYYMVTNLKSLECIFYDLTMLNGAYPTLEELSLCSGYSVKDLIKLFNSSRQVVSFSTKVIVDDEASTLDEVVPDCCDVEDLVVEKILINDLDKILKEVLNEKEYFVITNKYGFIDDECSTLTYIAKELNISRETVRNIEKRAFNKIRFELLHTYKYGFDILEKVFVR